MTVLFAGAMDYEFGNVLKLDKTPGRFDPDYSLGAITKSARNDLATVSFKSTASEIWVHCKALLGDDCSSVMNPIIGILSESGAWMGGLYSYNSGMYLSPTSDYSGSALNVYGLVQKNVLIDLDLHCYQNGSKRYVELYQNGIIVGRYGSTMAWTQPGWIQLGAMSNDWNSFSEVIITEGPEPTLAWRLHSKLPNPALPGLNTFDQGYWGALASDSLTDGVLTQSAGARITGGFQAYTGPATPLGIRGVLQSGRYLKNGVGLTLGGSLRINEVNYDNPDYEFIDASRVISFWEKNPATNQYFTVEDFAAMQGGFYTKAA